MTEAPFLRYTPAHSIVKDKLTPKVNDETAADANVDQPRASLGDPHGRTFRRTVVPPRRRGLHFEAPDENRS